MIVWVGRALVKQVTKSPGDILKELQASIPETVDTVHTNTVAWVLHYSELYSRVKVTVGKTHMTCGLVFQVSRGVNTFYKQQ